jgi:hypothetical protein
MALADMLVLLMVGIFEEHRWGGLQLRGIHTKCHEISQVYLQLSEGVQVSTWTKSFHERMLYEVRKEMT